MADQCQLNFNDRVKRADAKKRPSAEPPLPQNNDGTGYAKFQAEQAEFFRELGDRFGIILNQRVRVKLKDMDQEFEGKLVMDQLFAPASRKEELRLRVGSIEFYYTDIEHAILLEEKA